MTFIHRRHFSDTRVRWYWRYSGREFGLYLLCIGAFGQRFEIVWGKSTLPPTTIGERGVW